MKIENAMDILYILFLFIILASIASFIAAKLAENKVKGWPGMDDTVFQLALTTYHVEELRRTKQMIRYAHDKDELSYKIPVYRLAIDILVSFNRRHLPLRDRLKRIHLENELNFEEELKELIEAQVPPEYWITEN